MIICLKLNKSIIFVPRRTGKTWVDLNFYRPTTTKCDNLAKDGTPIGYTLDIFIYIPNNVLFRHVNQKSKLVPFFHSPPFFDSFYSLFLKMLLIGAEDFNSLIASIALI